MRSFLTISLALLVPGFLACSHETKPDPDADPGVDAAKIEKLPRMPEGLDIDDSVDAQTDKSDYRVVKATLTGKAKVEYDFAEGSTVNGRVGIVTTGGKEIVSKEVTPDETKYVLEWDAEADTSYLARVEATSGKAAYKMNASFTAPPPKDPCADVDCEDTQDCKVVDGVGKCVDKPVVECSPKCTGGKTCEAGVCVAPCGGPCGSGKMCNRKTNECVKDPCAGKSCPDGQKCSNGTCKDVPKPPPATCKPACAADEKCDDKTLKCVKQAVVDPGTGTDPGTGPLVASVIQIIPNGTSSVVILNKGAGAHVAVGQTGSISGVAGHSFRITEVYPVRCKAVIDVDAATIGNAKGAVIQRGN